VWEGNICDRKRSAELDAVVFRARCWEYRIWVKSRYEVSGMFWIDLDDDIFDISGDRYLSTMEI
jgi:hypothetical protein